MIKKSNRFTQEQLDVFANCLECSNGWAIVRGTYVVEFDEGIVQETRFEEQSDGPYNVTPCKVCHDLVNQMDFDQLEAAMSNKEKNPTYGQDI